MYASVLTLSNYATKVQTAKVTVTLILFTTYCSPKSRFLPMLR